MKKMGVIALMALVLCCATTSADEVEVSNLQPTQNTNACFRLFPTNNIWTFLELDTRTGLAWQVQFGLEGPNDRSTVILNDLKLAPATATPSPMTLAFDQNADGLGTSKIPHPPILVGGEFSRLHYGSLSLRPADLLALVVGADQVLTQPTRTFT